MIRIFKILSLSFFAIFLAGCNSNSELESQVDDLKKELAATEAELEDQKSAEEVWDELASKKTKK
tara:strand:+ start:160 stop:354 length:195 start_codon:yes stop_codon:yes gene_type:complete